MVVVNYNIIFNNGIFNNWIAYNDLSIAIKIAPIPSLAAQTSWAGPSSPEVIAPFKFTANELLWVVFDQQPSTPSQMEHRFGFPIRLPSGSSAPPILQKLLSCSPVFTGCECRAWLCWIHPRTPTQRHFAGHLKCVQSQESWGPKVPRIQGNRDCSGYLRRGECIFQPHRESHRNETFSVRSSSRCKWRWLREGNRFWKSHH